MYNKIISFLSGACLFIFLMVSLEYNLPRSEAQFTNG